MPWLSAAMITFRSCEIDRLSPFSFRSEFVWDRTAESIVDLAAQLSR